MTNWKDKIEAQIARLNFLADVWKKTDRCSIYKDAADTMQALLDVAVAADAMERKGRAGNACGEIGAYHAMCDALDKLREVGDEKVA